MSMFYLPSEDFLVVAPSKEVSLVTGEGLYVHVLLTIRGFPCGGPIKGGFLGDRGGVVGPCFTYLLRSSP